MVVLDTSTVSAIMHRQPYTLERLRTIRPTEVVLSAPVAAEIHFGLQRLASGSRKRKVLEGEYTRLRQVVNWADWSEDAAEEFGRQKARLAEAGDLIEDMDIVIASIARTMGATVATANARHFSRIRGLDVEDWTTPPHRRV